MTNIYSCANMQNCTLDIIGILTGPRGHLPTPTKGEVNEKTAVWVYLNLGERLKSFSDKLAEALCFLYFPRKEWKSSTGKRAKKQSKTKYFSGTCAEEGLCEQGIPLDYFFDKVFDRLWTQGQGDVVSHGEKKACARDQRGIMSLSFFWEIRLAIK